MNWRTKARIQSTIALLPQGLSYRTYYWFQRKLGGLRRVSPMDRIRAGVEFCERIAAALGPLDDKVIFELGTGRRINMPLTFWLRGAGETVTVDLNPYLKEELVREDMRYLRDNRAEVAEALRGDEAAVRRLDELIRRTSEPWRIRDLLEFCNIKYLSPCDASALPLAESSIDYHVSYTTLEHIPADVLVAILREGNRVVKPDGRFLHRIDMTDHFAHSDRSISWINFLQYDQASWNRIAGNRYMYQNRLRIDDYERLYDEAGHDVVSVERIFNRELESLIESGELRIDEKFRAKPMEVLLTTGAWVLSRSRRRG